MKLIYRDENYALVNHAKNLLENDGLKVILKNEYGLNGVDPNGMFMELWIQSRDETQALNVLAALGDKKQSDNWLCESCGESNDMSFEICWRCKHDSLKTA